MIDFVVRNTPIHQDQNLHVEKVVAQSWNAANEER